VGQAPAKPAIPSSTGERARAARYAGATPSTRDKRPHDVAKRSGVAHLREGGGAFA
jgi:hypothetical protein